MKKLIAFALLLFPVFSIGQTTTENYVKTTAYQIATQTGTVTDDQKIETISYYDGLGRAKQTVSAKAGGDKQNIVQLITYDSLGRTNKQYLPYATGAEIPNSLDFTNQGILKSSIETFYNTTKYENTLNPYSETLFENSPLNRPVRQGAPGNSWKIQKDSIYDHTVHYIYTTNTVSDANDQGDDVLDFEVIFNGNDITQPSLQLVGIHPENNLSRTIIQDENFEQVLAPTGPSGPFDPPLQEHQIVESGNHASEEFTNKKGQVILKRTYNNDIAHDTYYIYDDFGNLTYVLSPEASNQIVSGNNLVSNHQEVLDKLGYQYKYDYRNRLIKKKIPAKGWESIVYNRLDKPILTQDANQYTKTPKREWLFTKYDAFGRVVYTGIKRANISRTTFQIIANDPANLEQYEQVSPTLNVDTGIYYSSDAIPAAFDPALDEILTVNYYDTYKDLGGYTLPTSVYGQAVTTNTKGLPTVSKVRVLGTDHWITTLTLYDEKARPIFARSENTYLGTIDTSESLLDFTGKVLESRTSHQKSGHQEVITKDFFSYDHQNRLITHMQQIDNEPVQLIASNTYDELGQLESKRVGGGLFESGYTDITAGRIEISEDGIITKIDGGASYNAGLATVGKIEGDGGISFINLTENKRYIIGFNDNNQYTNSTSEIDYAFFFHWTNPGRYRVRIRENNVNTYITGYITYNANDNFAIEREGDILSFIQNGTTVATHTMTQNFPSLVGDMVMYDEGTQISSLNLYATNINKSLQKVDYQYNIRGWLTDINNNNSKEGDLFHFHINYDSKQGMSATGSITPLYNGNISQTMWKTANTDNQIRAYGYAYDDLNRINSGFSRRGTNFDTVDSYSLINVSYDKNGNIGGLERRGLGSGTEVIDDLTYTYDGNQLLSVTDLSANTSSSISNQGFYDGNTSGDDFEYDVNGNMIKDRNKGITDNIEYNHLNLPEIVKINTTDSQGNTQQGTITYIYDATGIKLAKIVDDQSQNSTITTYYAGGYIYENNNNNVESLKMFPHPEGYVEPVYSTSKSIQKFNTLTQATSFSSYQYAFNYTDHLGNVRLTYADSDGDGAITPSSEIISEKHYYPFGLQQKGYNDVVTSNSNSMAERFAFNGKENNPELGLEWYDFGARNYDASLGRWMNIDPMADLYVDMSPYHNVANNPIIFIDPEGESYYYAQDGTFLFETDDDKDDVYAWQEGEGKKRTHNPDGSYQDEWVEGSFGQLKHDGEAVSHDVFLGFAAAVAEESSGDKNESFAIASTTLNFLAEGGSTQLQTLEDLVLYDNNFIQGATQKGYSEYLKSKNKNSENEIGAVINALSGGTDYSGGANGWDGIDLISTKHSNSHRGYRWSSDSKSLVEKYRKDNNGGVKVGKWTYTSKNPQIQVQRIVKKTIFTKLLTGRGERKQSETKFKK